MPIGTIVKCNQTIRKQLLLMELSASFCFYFVSNFYLRHKLNSFKRTGEIPIVHPIVIEIVRQTNDTFAPIEKSRSSSWDKRTSEGLEYIRPSRLMKKNFSP